MARKVKHENLREACIDQAIEIIELSGIEQLSFREVARRLGVSHQAPYKHFPSRDHILAAIVQRTYKDFASFLDEVPFDNRPEVELEALGNQYLKYALSNPLQYRLMFSTPLPDLATHPSMMDGAQHAYERLQRVIDRMALPVNSAHNAMFAWSTIHGLASLLQAQVMAKVALTDEAVTVATKAVMAQIKDSLLIQAK